ncbi:MAG: STAS domain-containing protein [Armatimonadota bacterium]
MPKKGDAVPEMENIRLEVIPKDNQGVPVIRFSGEIDVYTVPMFKKAIYEAIDSGKKHIVVDLSDVSYMDSSGFGTLLGATKRLRPVGGSLSLVGCNEVITRMLKITRLDTIFRMHPSEAEAVNTILSGTG